ncbi:MAG: hypothetical protein HY271_00080 [Deltaproteobacteria bacterium]|nr:hypothetical protein [Deltaproteobacteria bacterium]
MRADGKVCAAGDLTTKFQPDKRAAIGGPPARAAATLGRSAKSTFHVRMVLTVDSDAGAINDPAVQ